MPRKSPYTIVLQNQQEAALRAIARKYTSAYIDVLRAKIVLYSAEGLDNQQIAERLDTPRQIVSKWRKRFYEEGLAGLAGRPRRGRPPLFSPRRSGSDQGSGL